MPNEKKETGIVGQIVVSILVALIAGGTVPWWWDKFFGSGSPPTQPSPKPHSPVIEPRIVQPSPPTPQVESPSSPPFGIAPKSWCMGMRDQWKFRLEKFGTNDESIAHLPHPKVSQLI